MKKNIRLVFFGKLLWIWPKVLFLISSEQTMFITLLLKIKCEEMPQLHSIEKKQSFDFV